MSRLPVAAVAFDLDGTLADTLSDLAEAADAMLLTLGRSPLGEPEVRKRVGQGMAMLVSRCLDRPVDDPLVAEGISRFRRIYSACNGRRARCYTGVREGLSQLRAMGLPLAVVTNKPLEFTRPLLASLALEPEFDLIVGGDSLSEKKPHPAPLWHVARHFGIAPADLLMVGDSENDVEAAWQAGCPVFCVPYGYDGGGSVDTAKCDALVSGIDAVAAHIVVQRLDGFRDTTES